MAKLDGTYGAQAILYLSWVDSEAEEWKATWNPETVGIECTAAQPQSLSKPVEEALVRLTSLINLGTGLVMHPTRSTPSERSISYVQMATRLILSKYEDGPNGTTGAPVQLRN